MHPQLETLLEIQDLKTQRRELQETASERAMQEEVFNLGADQAIVQLDEKIAEMEDTLPTLTRNRYNRIASRYERVMVPVIGGTCYGCFVSVPTALSSDADRNNEVRACQNCGRFLYLID